MRNAAGVAWSASGKQGSGGALTLFPALSEPGFNPRVSGFAGSQPYARAPMRVRVGQDSAHPLLRGLGPVPCTMARPEQTAPLAWPAGPLNHHESLDVAYRPSLPLLTIGRGRRYFFCSRPPPHFRGLQSGLGKCRGIRLRVGMRRKPSPGAEGCVCFLACGFSERARV